MYENSKLGDIIPKEVVVQAEVKDYQGIPNLDRIPDFFSFIKPSSNERNLAVIEFKITSRKGKILKDFEKLTALKRELRYRYLIEVIIGDEKYLNNC